MSANKNQNNLRSLTIEIKDAKQHFFSRGAVFLIIPLKVVLSLELRV